MPSGGGNPFPTEGFEERIAAAIRAHGPLMRQIAGHVSRGKVDEQDTAK